MPCNLSLITLITHCHCDMNGETIVTLHSLEREVVVENNSPTPKDKSNTPSAGLQGHSFLLSPLHTPTKNTLQQECGFKEMSNVYSVVFVQAEGSCIVQWRTTWACPPPIHQQSVHGEVRCFYKHPYITWSWHIIGAYWAIIIVYQLVLSRNAFCSVSVFPATPAQILNVTHAILNAALFTSLSLLCACGSFIWLDQMGRAGLPY